MYSWSELMKVCVTLTPYSFSKPFTTPGGQNPSSVIHDRSPSTFGLTVGFALEASVACVDELEPELPQASRSPTAPIDVASPTPRFTKVRRLSPRRPSPVPLISVMTVLSKRWLAQLVKSNTRALW